MDWNEIYQDTFIPEIPKLWNGNFNVFKRYLDVFYESLEAANTGNTPDSNPDKWLITNADSLRLKVFINSAQNKAISDVNLVRRHVDNQYLYNLVEQNREAEGEVEGKKRGRRGKGEEGGGGHESLLE